jgi:hypothetical protein
VTGENVGWGTRRTAAVVLAGGLALTGCGGGSDDEVPVAAATPSVEQTPSAGPSASTSTAPGDIGADLELNASLLNDVVAGIDENAKGFAQVVQNIPKRKLTIYWKGTPPAKVAALKGTSGTGVEVVIVQSKLSKADVDAAITRISQAAQSGRVPQPDSISANKDFSGIVVGFTEEHFAANNNASVRTRYESVAKVPVTIARAASHALD